MQTLLSAARAGAPSAAAASAAAAAGQFGMAVARIRTAVAVRRPAAADAAERCVRLVGVVPALPTEHGALHVRAYHDPAVGDLLAIVWGDVRGMEAVPLRVHDQCQMEEIFGVQRCGCSQRLRTAIAALRDGGAGVLLYMPLEGRGAGLAASVAACELEDRFGCTADEAAGVVSDGSARDYGGVPAVLDEMEVRSVRVMGDDAEQLRALRELGIREAAEAAGAAGAAAGGDDGDEEELCCLPCGGDDRWPVPAGESVGAAVARLRAGTVPLPAPGARAPRPAPFVAALPAAPSRLGPLHIRVYRDPVVGDLLAVVWGDVRGKEGVPLRVHDQCQTSEVFGSRKCDCKQQLDATAEMMRDGGLGVLLYMPQEGRGIGLANKMAAYELQERFGCDTVDANTLIGLADERRDYCGVPAVLADLGISSVRLVTNNPYKVRSLAALGVRVDERHRAVFCAPHKESERYLAVKERRMGHAISEGSEVAGMGRRAGEEAERARAADGLRLRHAAIAARPYAPSAAARAVASDSSRDQMAQAAVREHYDRRPTLNLPAFPAAAASAGARAAAGAKLLPAAHAPAAVIS